MKTRFVLSVLFVAVLVPLIVSAGHSKTNPPTSRPIAAAASQPNRHALQAGSDSQNQFQLTSTTFRSDEQFPATMIFNGTLGSVCTGGNESPELSWTPAGNGTRSYAVAMFDVTANFTHWGIYNIPAATTELPTGAGSPGSTTAQQVFNDAGIQGYSGPCPPPDIVPAGIHHYVFTVYALDQMLDLTPSPDFPPSADALYRALINHVINQASVSGVFSCSKANENNCS